MSIPARSPLVNPCKPRIKADGGGAGFQQSQVIHDWEVPEAQELGWARPGHPELVVVYHPLFGVPIRYEKRPEGDPPETLAENSYDHFGRRIRYDGSGADLHHDWVNGELTCAVAKIFQWSPKPGQ